MKNYCEVKYLNYGDDSNDMLVISYYNVAKELVFEDVYAFDPLRTVLYMMNWTRDGKLPQ